MTPNHRLERAATGRWWRAASALRYCALASPWTRLRPALNLIVRPLFQLPPSINVRASVPSSHLRSNREQA